MSSQPDGDQVVVPRRPRTGLLIFTVILVVIIVVFLFILIYRAYQASRNPTRQVVILPPCNDTVNVTTLVQIPSTAPRCFIGGVEQNTYFIGNINPAYNYVVGPSAVPAQTVCLGYCQTFNSTTQVCTGQGSGGTVSAQTEYDNCITQLSSTSCQTPLPVAALGPVVYYPQSVTQQNCEGPLPS